MAEENERIETEKPWEELAELLHRSDEEKVSALLKSLGPGELAHTVLLLKSYVVLGYHKTCAAPEPGYDMPGCLACR
jgi:hypothetical protein